MTFDAILHEGFERVQPRENNLQRAHDAMLAANHLAIILPLWLGTMPAILSRARAPARLGASGCAQSKQWVAQLHRLRHAHHEWRHARD
jgi:hypothetical protein